MKKETLRKLTEEEKMKITLMMNDLLSEDFPDEPTEYDVLMKQKLEEFIAIYLKDDEPSKIEKLLETSEKYINGDTIYGLGFIMAYDMWINESPTFPTQPNPKWEEWEKLKDKKIK